MKNIIGNLSKLKEADVTAFILFNIVIAFFFSYAHISTSQHLLNWEEFIAFKGGNPFQQRLLPFLAGSFIDLLHPMTNRALKKLFLVQDFISSIVCVSAIIRTVQIYSSNKLGAFLALFIFWLQTFSIYLGSLAHNYYFPYDAISMAVIAYATYLILSEAPFAQIVAVTILGMINRETAVLIPLFYIAYNCHKWRSYTFRFLFLVGLCIAIKAAIALFFGQPESTIRLWHEPGFLRLYYNFSFVTLDIKYLHTLNFLFAFGGVWILLFVKGGIPDSIKRILLCFYPFIVGMMFVGNLSEIRIFGDFIPLLTLALTLKLVSYAETTSKHAPT